MPICTINKWTAGITNKDKSTPNCKEVEDKLIKMKE